MRTTANSIGETERKRQMPGALVLGGVVMTDGGRGSASYSSNKTRCAPLTSRQAGRSLQMLLIILSRIEAIRNFFATKRIGNHSAPPVTTGRQPLNQAARSIGQRKGKAMNHIGKFEVKGEGRVNLLSPSASGPARQPVFCVCSWGI